MRQPHLLCKVPSKRPQEYGAFWYIRCGTLNPSALDRPIVKSVWYVLSVMHSRFQEHTKPADSLTRCVNPQTGGVTKKVPFCMYVAVLYIRRPNVMTLWFNGTVAQRTQITICVIPSAMVA